MAAIRAVASRALAGLGLAAIALVASVAAAQEPTAAVASAETAAVAPPSDLVLHNRRIVTFRATLLGDTPAERVAMAQAAIDAALAASAPASAAARVSRSLVGEAVRLEIDGATAFFVVPQDLPGPRPVPMLDAVAHDAQLRLQKALDDAHEMHDPRRLALGAAWAVGASALALLLVRVLFALRRRAAARIDDGLQDRLAAAQSTGTAWRTWGVPLRVALRFVLGLGVWVLVVLVLDAWLTFVLHQFAYTRPWGERSTAWLVGVAGQFVQAIAQAVPGLVIAGLIFAIARLVARGGTLLLRRVERGQVHLSWLDADIAAPTRRLFIAVVWLFALAMAYPYLPGSGSEAFKGVTVLAGLMLSLGASNVVGQALSGLSLMYARAMRVGEFVRIGDTEGVVTALGLLATKLRTAGGEEVSLPNAVVFGQPVHNQSRLAGEGRAVLSTAVTIGYATPWRQVHALLLEAARRTAGLADDPAPFVLQTALSDFYVEYRLCAHGGPRSAAQRPALLHQLHAHVLDVFNEHGVQIMSPHYMADPPQAQVVPREAWFTPPARPASE